MRFLTYLLSCIVLYFCTYVIAYGQPSNAANITTPKIIPPSPDAQAFMRYGTYPVDYSTGVPKIELPLYEISSGSLRLPISISYHASGIPVNDIPSVVGLGWKLDAGGIFTRTVKGRADETSQGMLTVGYLNKSEIDNASQITSNYYKLRDASHGAQDTESDSYFYSSGDGLSSQFIYDHDKNIVPLSFSTDKIIKHSTSNIYGTTYYPEIIRDNGASYSFETQELTLSDAEWYPSSWWLTKIVAPNKTDSIMFEYQRYDYSYVDYFLSESWTYSINSDDSGSTGLVRNGNSTQTYPQLLKKITFNNGYILFDYSHDRIDMRDSRLTAMSIFNMSGILIKRYRFVHSYFNSGFDNNKYNYRLKLDKVEVYDGQDKFINSYILKYNDKNVLPPYYNPGANNPTACYAVDYWGYYNGKTQNVHMIPFLPDTDHPADRTPNEAYTKACMLYAVSYPTGGYSLFEYESNVKYDGSRAGGLRIKSITSCADLNAQPVVRRYQYTNNLLNRSIDLDAEGMYKYPQRIMTVPTSNCGIWENNSIVCMDNATIPFQSHSGTPAIYQIVDEYVDGGQSGNLKTTYTYSAEPDIIYSVTAPRYQNQYFIDRSWRRGQIIGTHYFKQTNGTYKPVKSTNIIYADYKTNTIVEGTKVLDVLSHPDEVVACNLFYTYSPGTPFSDIFYYFDITLEVGIKKIIKEYTNEYDEAGNVQSIEKNYIYGSQNHLYPTSISYSDSKGDNRSTQLKYPHDFSATSVYSSMISRNMISPVIQQFNYKNDVFLESTTTNYKAWSSALIAPETIETKNGNNASEVRLRFTAYDSKGNVLSVLKENDIPTTYLWGYSSSYPVAKIDNITFVSVSSNTALTGYINQLQNYTDLNDASLRSGLKTLNGNIRNSLPKGAFITTYTYSPLKGTTSQTDANGVCLYYQYDDFSRLQLIKDNNEDVVKYLTYNFRQRGDFQIYYSSASSSEFTKVDCPAGSEGSVVAYTVPEGAYYSINSQDEADQKATAAVTSNGQSYANSNGECFLSNLVYLNYKNFTSITFNAKYTNTATGDVYNFALAANSIAAVDLGTIPRGTYNVSILPVGGTALCDFSIYGYSQAGVSSISTTDVNLNCNCGSIEIDNH